MQVWVLVAAAALAAAGGCGLAERRRGRRDGMDRVGWVPWSGLTVLALFVFAGAVALGMHG
ncbi:hypothetical protein [Sphingomonas quercus]|uniref:Uncharacterized protein n=1 Tax=Sphingomonas quercus TaxID=2842451 RepID=A0ABS6BG59_9SPHN|nr:hypothetical protein [Sphingomonas quercus]MBU3076567.1 hypothetical protein [Sphingomonas quercus]